MEYGCIAEHLGHSFSKSIHEKIDSYDYVLREVPKTELDAFMRARAFQGINVTIPYKQDVIPYLDALSETAKDIGAVNTIVNRDGKLFGDNTDFGGMTALIRRMGLDLSGKKVLVLGTGGTSRTAVAVAQRLGCAWVRQVSRTAKDGVLTYADVYEKHTDTQIILNTTPAGMFPKIDDMPIRPEAFPALEGVADAIFNPLRSKLVLSSRAAGVPAEGGLYMLVAQAVLAAKRFTEKTYAPELTDTVFQALLREKENLVLIGMPGSGKTTVGKRAAETLGRTFVDLDDEIVRRAGCPIPEIFAKQGEKAFRDLETEITRETAARSGLVIATGGGCVLREENVRFLRMNGRLLFLDRPLEQLLPTDDRPTANSKEKICALYETRLPIYRAAADAVIRSDGDASRAAEAVCKQFLEVISL
ncbi:MAG: shikimate dehydrogenase [Clostridia bacterium]|nr:shikimate dehydrogenase [Clostridia bacterium]